MIGLYEIVLRKGGSERITHVTASDYAKAKQAALNVCAARNCSLVRIKFIRTQDRGAAARVSTASPNRERGIDDGEEARTT